MDACARAARKGRDYGPTVTDSPLNDDVLRDLEVLTAAATPEPWDAFREEEGGLAGCSFIQLGAEGYSPPDMHVYHDDKIAPGDDLDFIAAARKYMPLLIAEVRRLRGLSSAT